MGWHKFCILRRVGCSALTTFYWYGIIKTTWLYKSYIIDKKLKWATSWQNQQSGMCAQRRLISLGIHPVWSVFTVSMKKAWVLSYPSSAQQSLIKLGGCPGWSESSLGAHASLLVLSWGGSNHDLKKTPWATMAHLGEQLYKLNSAF